MKSKLQKDLEYLMKAYDQEGSSDHENLEAGEENSDDKPVTQKDLNALMKALTDSVAPEEDDDFDYDFEDYEDHDITKALDGIGEISRENAIEFECRHCGGHNEVENIDQTAILKAMNATNGEIAHVMKALTHKVSHQDALIHGQASLLKKFDSLVGLLTKAFSGQQFTPGQPEELLHKGALGAFMGHSASPDGKSNSTVDKIADLTFSQIGDALTKAIEANEITTKDADYAEQCFHENDFIGLKQNSKVWRTLEKAVTENGGK